MINDILREHLDDFSTICLDNILVFSKNKKDHKKYFHLVLEKLHQRGLYATLEKCLFYQIIYLNLVHFTTIEDFVALDIKPHLSKDEKF